MKTTLTAIAFTLAGFAPAFAAETTDSLQPVIDTAVEAVSGGEDGAGAPQCGRYHEIRDYRSETCAEQIFEDIEMDAPGGA